MRLCECGDGYWEHDRYGACWAGMGDPDDSPRCDCRRYRSTAADPVVTDAQGRDEARWPGSTVE